MASLGSEERSPLRGCNTQSKCAEKSGFSLAADRYVTSSVDFDRRTQSRQRGNRFERAL